jgi:hypothetical protein
MSQCALQAKTLVDWLQRHYPGQDWQRQRRTVERRVHQWKAQQGPAKEVFFRQVHEPGRLGSSDFTHMDNLGVTIQGQPFPHLLYHFVLTNSNWEHATVCFSESFASLSAGLQKALGELGGAPERHRTDRMTLAVNQEGRAEEFTPKYQALMRERGRPRRAAGTGSDPIFCQVDIGQEKPHRPNSQGRLRAVRVHPEPRCRRPSQPLEDDPPRAPELLEEHSRPPADDPASPRRATRPDPD